MRSCPQKWLGYFFGVGMGWGSDNSLSPRRLHRFWRSIRQATSFRANMCLLGVPKKSLHFDPFSPHNVDFVGIFDGTNFRLKTALALWVPREKVSYSCSYDFESWMFNRQTDHPESKYVIGFWTGRRFHLDTAHAQTWMGKLKPKSHSISTAISQKQ